MIENNGNLRMYTRNLAIEPEKRPRAWNKFLVARSLEKCLPLVYYRFVRYITFYKVCWVIQIFNILLRFCIICNWVWYRLHKVITAIYSTSCEIQFVSARGVSLLHEMKRRGVNDFFEYLHTTDEYNILCKTSFWEYEQPNRLNFT